MLQGNQTSMKMDFHFEIYINYI